MIIALAILIPLEVLAIFIAGFLLGVKFAEANKDLKEGEELKLPSFKKKKRTAVISRPKSPEEAAQMRAEKQNPIPDFVRRKGDPL